MAFIRKGDDTNSFGNSFLVISLDEELVNEETEEVTTVPITGTTSLISKAIFQCGAIRKSFINPSFPLEIELTAQETKLLQENNTGYLKVYDADGKGLTCDGYVQFTADNEVVE
jgi:hypothetical protein